MPPSNFLFQIGCFFTGSRTTIPPSADTRTFTGSVVRPTRTFGPDGPSRTGPDGAGEARGAEARPDEAARAPAPTAKTTMRTAATRRDGVIKPWSLACRCISPPRPLSVPRPGQTQELGAQRRAFSERAGVGRRDDARPLLPRPADGHAEVLRLHRAGGALRAERPRERLHDLARQSLLKLPPVRQRVHRPGDLRQADETIVRH